MSWSAIVFCRPDGTGMPSTALSKSASSQIYPASVSSSSRHEEGNLTVFGRVYALRCDTKFCSTIRNTATALEVA
jgi:hypothetical protein